MFGALAHSLYTRDSLDPRDTEAWKYYYNLRFKQTSTEFRSRIITDASISEKRSVKGEI